MYGNHQKQTATKCGHGIHPSAPVHTPRCPRCVVADSKAKVYTAGELLCLNGGSSAAVHVRGQGWNVAMLRYDIARQRLKETRKREIWRRERERAWDVAHRQGGLRHVLAGTRPSDCAVCASMTTLPFIEMTPIQMEKEMPWWERLNGLVHDHVLVPRTPLALRSPSSSPMRDYEAREPSILRAYIQHMRSELSVVAAFRTRWETQNRLESAVRRKHGLADTYPLDPDFWDSPLPEIACRRNYMNAENHQRLVARRARGNKLRPKPPRSSLSLSEAAAEVEMDENQLKGMKRAEEAAEMGRLVDRAGREVGYLYFVGSMECMEEWNDDYLKSDRQLVWRDEKTVREDRHGEDRGDGEDKGDGEDDEMDLD